MYEDISDSDRTTAQGIPGDETDVYGGKAPGPYWHEQLSHAQKAFDKWEVKAHRVVKRYRDERDGIEWPRTKFNILWSNVQILNPSLYGRMPKPQVSRRYEDNDQVGRLASTILERAIEYEVEQFADFNSTMASVVQDRLLPGRGVGWIRYCPVIAQQPGLEAQGAPNSEVEREGVGTTNTEEAPREQVVEAHSPIDYVYWQDFLHSPARTWEEVWWVARWVYMTRAEGVERFGDVFKNVGLSSQNADKDSKSSIEAKSGFAQKAKVAEIWNKRTGRVCWVAKGYPQALDEREDPLKLETFFPCPKPLLATTTNGSMIPVPDYCEYEDQAIELDAITNRITMLVRAVKVAGVFNAEYKELGRLFTEGIDNKLFPVTSWAAMSEKGGLKGAIDIMDISGVLGALAQLYASRDSVKQIIYEICGISDILRGSTDAGETFGAQQLKANFGSLRLKSSQTDVARFASDLFRLKAEIICKYYPLDLIVQMSGVANTPDGQNPQLLQAALQMLQDSQMRDFRITVESDTLAQIDEQAEKQAAVEAVQAISGFLQQAIPMVAQSPETLPMAAETLLFLTRRFRAGRGLESAIERAMAALQKKADTAAGQEKMSDEQQKTQAQQQTDRARIQSEAQLAQMRNQMESQLHAAKLESEMRLEQLKSQQADQSRQHELNLKAASQVSAQEFEKWKAQLDASTRIMVAQIAAKAQIDKQAMGAARASVERMAEATPMSGDVLHDAEMGAVRGSF